MLGLIIGQAHYNNKRLFCDPHIIANNKERSSRKPAFANHNSSQTLNLLRYNNIRTRTIANPSQLPNLIPSQNVSDYNCFYIQFAIHITSKTLCNKPIPATTQQIDSKAYRFPIQNPSQTFSGILRILTRLRQILYRKPICF